MADLFGGYTYSTPSAPPNFPPFKSSPSVISVGDKLYMKDLISEKFVPYVPINPPTREYTSLWPKLAYDNTTCANWCCRKVDVFKDGCSENWTQCATLNPDSTLSQCNQTQRTGCSSWVPCDTDPRSWFYTVWGVFFGITVISICICCSVAPENKEEDNIKELLFILTFIVVLSSVILLSFALVTVSDYKHWVAQTETTKDFIAYQECTRFCNNINDPNVIQTRFCADTPSNGFDIFPDANINPFSNGTCPPSSSDDAAYCQSCYSHIHDWQQFQNAQAYLEIRTCIDWIMILLTAIAVILWQPAFMQALIIGSLFMAAYFIFIVLDIRAVVYTNRLSATLNDNINAGMAVPVNLKAVFICLIVWDFIAALYISIILYSFHHTAKLKQAAQEPDNKSNKSLLPRMGPGDLIRERRNMSS